MSIGIFDSGLGGVTALNVIKKNYKQKDIVFYGDTCHLPYGDKSRKEIIKYSEEIVNYLIDKGVEVIVIACNSATSNALDTLKEKYDIPIIGVIDPAIKKLSTLGSKKVGVIATETTIKSNKYYDKIKELDENIDVYSVACPKFVPVIESGKKDGEEIEKLIDLYISQISEKIDTLILGCTHYTIIKDVISRKYPKLTIIDPSIEVSRELENYISNINENGNIEYIISGNVEKFKNNLESIFGKDKYFISKVEGK